jgi:AraC-like DNA-binding protein
MDALSSVLQAVKLSGGIFLDARFTAPWCVTAAMTADDCRPYLTNPAQLIAYHYVLEGRLLLQVEQEPAVEVGAGEIVLLPRNDAHVMASAAGLRPVRAGALVQPSESGGLARIEHGGGGAPTRIICGCLGSDEAHNPLISALPRALKLDLRDARARDWVEASVRFAAQELALGGLAAAGVVARVAELLLVEAVRSYASALPTDQAGWLKGLSDPYVGRALALIHGELSRDWTTEELARAAALSRSAFAERFASAVGMPPMRYVTHWRMQLAKQALLEARKPVAQIAFIAGYDSEAAFSRAFKREFGEPPARWRAARRSA